MLARALKARWLPAACLAIVAAWYPLLMGLLGFAPFQPLDFGLAFNSMAEHLLAGRFDVDPDAIGAEGFDRDDGRTVAYFGIFCALLRVPLVLVPRFAKLDVTWWSCVVPLCLAAWFQARAVRAVFLSSVIPRPSLVIPRPLVVIPRLVRGTCPSTVPREVPRTSRGMTAGGDGRHWLAAGLLLVLLLGGPQIQFLRPSIYQEPINWGFAQAMAFVFLAVRGMGRTEGFDPRTLRGMALCAALALLTRVSFGIGLYAALGLLLLARSRPREWPWPVAILLLGAILTGIVNEGRWGNPLVFADYTRFNLSQDAWPGRLGRLAAYGAFHPARVWLGLSYYFLPVWVWLRADGHVLFAEIQAPLMDAMELPPGSFLLTDFLLLGLAAAGVWAIRDRGRAALLLGLCVPAGLMLCAISMAHRYRMEFYPAFILAALLGLGAVSGKLSAPLRALVVAGAMTGVLASHGMAVLYARSPWGPGEFYLERNGLIATYLRPER